jgi:hypothetical protein
MFIEVLFTIAKLWKQPRCPTTGELIKKVWYLHTVEFYSQRRMKFCHLENIILSEVSQALKAENHTFSLICGL